MVSLNSKQPLIPALRPQIKSSTHGYVRHFTCLLLSLRIPITAKPQHMFQETQLNIFKEIEQLKQYT